MLRTSLVLLALAVPAAAQKKISTVVAEGIGTCLYTPSAVQYKVDRNTWGIRLESMSSGHDEHGWIHEGFLFIGVRFDRSPGFGALVQAIAYFGAWNWQCWSDLRSELPWVAKLTMYAQFVARLPGCRNTWQASPVMRVVTDTRPE